MVTNQKTGGRATSIPMGVLTGVLTALIWTLIAAGILGKLMDMERIGEEAVGYGATVILLTASMLGAWAAYSKVKHQRIQVSLLTGVGYYLVLLSMTAMFFGGQYTGMGVTSLLVLGGSAATAFMGAGKGRKQKHYPKTRQ